MDTDDMVYSRDSDNNVMSGGYMIKNAFMKAGVPAIFGDATQVGGGSSLHNLAIPAGLVFLQRIAIDQKHGTQLSVDEPADAAPITGDLYSKLLDMVKVNKKRHGTRKRRAQKKNKSRKK